jgi:hypothetical protein
LEDKVKTSNNLMDMLYNHCKPLVEAKWFTVVMSITIFLNPIAIFPQVWTALTAPSVEGISAGMWFIFVIIQLAFIFHGIKSKSTSMFFSMVISLIETSTIIITVLIRS